MFSWRRNQFLDNKAVKLNDIDGMKDALYLAQGRSPLLLEAAMNDSLECIMYLISNKLVSINDKEYGGVPFLFTKHQS